MRATLALLWLLVFSATTTIVATIYFHELISSIVQDNSGSQAKIIELSQQLNTTKEQLQLTTEREQALLSHISNEQQQSSGA